MGKLRTFFSTMKTKKVTVKDESRQREFNFLHDLVPVIFPSENSKDLTPDEVNFAKDENDYFIANIDIYEEKPSNVYSEEYLPYHLYDNAWLAKYLESLIKDTNKHSRQQVKISRKNLLEFVTTDSVFAEARKAYEVDLTRAQIEFMMQGEKINGLMLKPNYNEKTKSYAMESFYNPVLLRLQEDPDKKFYHTVVMAMKKLNLNQESIETGLAKYSSLWLDPLTKDAFYNHYINNSFNEERFLELEGWYKQADCENFKEKWLHLRKYDYYQRDKKVFDKLGLDFPEMHLDQKQLMKMRKLCFDLDNQFQALTTMVNLVEKSSEIVA